MISLTVNKQTHELDVPDDMPLLWVLRDKLDLIGPKFGCGMAQCGACTVHLDGEPIRSCVTPISVAAGKAVTTIEDMAKDAIGKRVQNAWVEENVPQCGFCQAGQIMSAVGLLKSNPNPTDEDITEYMEGNICRCGTYNRISSAIHKAAKGE